MQISRKKVFTWILSCTGVHINGRDASLLIISGRNKIKQISVVGLAAGMAIRVRRSVAKRAAIDVPARRR